MGRTMTESGRARTTRHKVFQTSLMSALLDGVYDGDLTVGELLERGDFGLGTFNALDGEMVVLDSVCYQLRGDGRATAARRDQQTPFAVVTTFVPTITATLPPNASRDQVSAFIGGLIRSENYLYAIRITGQFDWVRTRTAARQRQPYPPLREATRNEPVVRLENVAGVVAGFRTPLYEQGIGVPGGHVHFLDDNRERGGHVLDFAIEHGTVQVCLGTDLHLALPLNDAFSNAHLAPDDIAEQIQQTERHR